MASCLPLRRERRGDASIPAPRATSPRGSGTHEETTEHDDREAAMAGSRLAGKVAIVTGAGSRAEGIGNGRAAAVLFAREGARVLCVDRSRAAAEATRAMIASEGGEAAVLEADVTRTED